MISKDDLNSKDVLGEMPEVLPNKEKSNDSINGLDDIQKKEFELNERMNRIAKLEQQVREKEKKQKEMESKKKQILLRIAPGLWNDLAQWAEEDFRSINGQIEYLLSESVRKRKNK